MKDTTLVDANSIGHAAHRGAVLKAGDQETQAVYGTIKTMRSLRLRNRSGTLLVLWDGKSWRKSQSAVYKSNREDSPEKIEERRRYKTQTPYIRKALHLLGIPQLVAFNLEADDLAAYLTRRYTARGDFVRLVTGDQDWLQMVGPNCMWEDHRDENKKVNVRTFQEWTGVSEPIQFAQLKALQGDISDSLPGVGGIGEKTGLELIKVWGRVEAFFADKDPEATWKAKGLTKVFKGVEMPKPFPKALKDFHANLDGRHEKFAHNFMLMNLTGDLPEPERMTLDKGNFDEAGFKSLCHELAFASIYQAGVFDTFIEPFRKH